MRFPHHDKDGDGKLSFEEYKQTTYGEIEGQFVQADEYFRNTCNNVTKFCLFANRLNFCGKLVVVTFHSLLAINYVSDLNAEYDSHRRLTYAQTLERENRKFKVYKL